MIRASLLLKSVMREPGSGARWAKSQDRISRMFEAEFASYRGEAMRFRSLTVCFLLIVLVSPCSAVEPAKAALLRRVPAENPNSTEAISAFLRDYLVHDLSGKLH